MTPEKKQESSRIANTNMDTEIHHEIFKNTISNIDVPELFRLLLANSQTAGIIIMDRNGIIHGMNIGVQRSFGYSFDELIGKNFSILFLEKDRLKELPQTELITVFQKGHARDENYCLHKDGSAIWTLGESVFTKNDKGEIFFIKFIFDINNQKLLEERLVNSNNKLNQTLSKISQVNNDLETFVYSASHDLKAPIGNIEALVNSLEDEIPVECRNKKEVAEMLSMINISIEKFRKTIDDLADVVRMQQSEGEEEGITQIEFSELIEDIKAILLKQIKESHSEITEDLSKVTSINFSRKNLRSILLNLISNAIKYRKPGVKPNIKISTEKSGEFILLKVSDNGLGIKEEDKDKIFSMYKRVHQHVEGTGVGMSIVSKILSNSGGKIEVESKVGEGSTFNVYLKPLSKGENGQNKLF